MREAGYSIFTAGLRRSIDLRHPSELDGNDLTMPKITQSLLLAFAEHDPSPRPPAHL